MIDRTLASGQALAEQAHPETKQVHWVAWLIICLCSFNADQNSFDLNVVPQW
jgi:hypothetical protein